MQIAFWSQFHGQTAATSNMVATAIMTALENRFNILVTQSHFQMNNLDLALIGSDPLVSQLTDLSDTGIDALSRFIRSNKISRDEFYNYTTSILRNKLDILEGTKIKNWEIFNSEYSAVLQLLLASAKSFYDLVYIDVAPGNTDMSNKILATSDLIVVNLSQNTLVLDKWFNEPPIDLDKVVYVIGKYDMDSKWNIKNIKRTYGVKNYIGAIPYDIEFADSCSDGKAVDFLIRNIEAEKGDYHYELVHQCRKVSREILKKVGLQIEVEESAS